METLQSLIQSGRAADILIAVMMFEAVALGLFRLITGRGFAVRLIISNLMAGLFLTLALKASLIGAPWPWTAASLAAAGVAHALDLVVRWPRS